jgi:2-polyprenyl-3-methyl-5-hydroxy-6-metoxy-1,4-benzoquinol methylase
MEKCMNCCQCQGIEDLFNEKAASKELEHYRKKGPDKTTRMMTDTLQAEGVQGLSLLDIGGGVGAVQHALLAAGAQSAVDVDASHAYLKAAKQEAARRGFADQVSFQYGNFVDIAAQVPPADIVTLDRVICCYDDMEKLVSLSAARARKLYAVVYPRYTWWVKIGVQILNFFFRLRKTPFRTFAHPTQAVEKIIQENGFRKKSYQQTLFWQVAIYSR